MSGMVPSCSAPQAWERTKQTQPLWYFSRNQYKKILQECASANPPNAAIAKYPSRTLLQTTKLIATHNTNHHTTESMKRKWNKGCRRHRPSCNWKDIKVFDFMDKPKYRVKIFIVKSILQKRLVFEVFFFGSAGDFPRVGVGGGLCWSNEHVTCFSYTSCLHLRRLQLLLLHHRHWVSSRHGSSDAHVRDLISSFRYTTSDTVLVHRWTCCITSNWMVLFWSNEEKQPL